MSDNCSADKVENIAKQSVDTESSLITKCESGTDGSQYQNFTVFDDIWASSATMNKNQKLHKLHARTGMKSNLGTDSNIRNNRLKSHAYEIKGIKNRNKLHNGELRGGEESGKLSSETVKCFKQNSSRRMASNNTIYLYENQTSKCVINWLKLIE